LTFFAIISFAFHDGKLHLPDIGQDIESINYTDLEANIMAEIPLEYGYLMSY
jgi:hypothetical protein